jgi:excisionase family DNA binding protein
MHKIEDTGAVAPVGRSDPQTRTHAATQRLVYSPSGGAQVLGISRSKIYELIAAGELKALKLGSRTLLLHSELVRFITELDAAHPRTRTEPGPREYLHHEP